MDVRYQVRARMELRAPGEHRVYTKDLLMPVPPAEGMLLAFGDGDWDEEIQSVRWDERDDFAEAWLGQRVYNVAEDDRLLSQIEALESAGFKRVL